MKTLLIALFFLLPTQAQMDELYRKKHPALRALTAHRQEIPAVPVTGLKKKLETVRRYKEAAKKAGFVAAILAGLGITAKITRTIKSIVKTVKKQAGKK